MPIIIGILSGMGLPFQTSVNTKLRKRVGSPFRASLISFFVAFVFLTFLLMITERHYFIPWGNMMREPAWVWTGGICGVIFLTGNILLFGKLGAVETVILPVMGQVIMGLAVDHFGFFHMTKIPLSGFRILGAVLVISGVGFAAIDKETGIENKNSAEVSSLYLWKIFGIFSGMISATQTAVNGYVGKIMGSPLKGAIISFTGGIIFLIIICLITGLKNRCSGTKGECSGRGPWWIWTGGILGGVYILSKTYLTRIMGTGFTVILTLFGSTAGGILIDRFGFAGSPKRPVTFKKIIGIFLMTAGVTMIRLL